MIEIRCENCDYWEGLDANNGICSRYPPSSSCQLIPKGPTGVIGGEQKMMLDRIEMTSWPVTLKDKSCGEFKNEC